MTETSKRQSADCPFIPMGERVILDLVKSGDKRGLIHIPQNAIDAPQYGIVKAIGDLVVDDLEVGDRVSFGKYSGNVLKDDNDKEYLVLNFDDILAKVKRD